MKGKPSATSAIFSITAIYDGATQGFRLRLKAKGANAGRQDRLHDERQADFAEFHNYLKEGLEVHFAWEYEDVFKVVFGKG